MPGSGPGGFSGTRRRRARPTTLLRGRGASFRSRRPGAALVEIVERTLEPFQVGEVGVVEGAGEHVLDESRHPPPIG